MSRWQQWSRDDRGGVFGLPFGEGRHAPIAASDQARVIASILTDPAPHDRQVYPLSGPVELAHLIQHLVNVAQDYRDGIFAGADNLVHVITGTPAKSVGEFVTANREAFETDGQEPAWARLRAS